MSRAIRASWFRHVKQSTVTDTQHVVNVGSPSLLGGS